LFTAACGVQHCKNNN